MKNRLYLLAISLMATVCMYAENVNLYFFVDGVEVHTESVTKDASFDLSSVTAALSAQLGGCRDYVFKGWQLNEPVADGGTPTLITSVTPNANKNLYAVFGKEEASTVYVQTNSTLSNGDYIIAAESGGVYYALGNYQEEVESNYYGVRPTVVHTQTVNNKLMIVNEQDAALVWTWTKTKGNKTIKSVKDNSIYIYPRYEYDYAYNYYILGESANITTTWNNSSQKWAVYNGKSRMVFADGVFKCIYSKDTYYYHFYFFKKGTETITTYTSTPSCTVWTIHLDAGDGTIGSAGSTQDLTETSPASGFTLPSATKPVGMDCGTWNFVGWHLNTPVSSTTSAPTLYSAGTYSATKNGETLYAVYRNGSGKGATYATYPHCGIYTVILRACGGTVEGALTTTKTEGSAMAGITNLPAATPLCDGWTFVGWVDGEDIASVKDVEYTGTIYKAGETYYPSQNGAKLFAVYSRLTDRFRIIHGYEEIVSGDNYLITYYAKESSEDQNVYDWMISSTVSGSNLVGVKGVAPQNGEGYYMLATDPNVIWTITGSGTSWKFKNTGNNQYLKLGNNGQTSTTAEQNTITSEYKDGFAIHFKNNSSYYLYFENGVFKTKTVGWYDSKPFCYVYRQENEYTSWPHCEVFTVNFDGCGGRAGETKMTEDVVYGGITLPGGYANSDCAKEGWAFAGWAEQPISEETESLTQDLFQAGTTYHPTKNNITLYAVYYQKSDEFRRISSMANLRRGVNYIVTYGNNAMANKRYNSSNYVASKTPTVSGQTITSEDKEIMWSVRGEVGEYVLYNEDRGVYLDLRTAGSALLTTTAEDNFLITADGNYYAVRSNMSIAASTAAKYLYYYSSRFYTSTDDNPSLYFYQRQATYHSYPNCVEPIDALRWSVEDDGYYVYVESFTQGGEPRLNDSEGDPEPQDDGSFRVKYDPTVLQQCAIANITWGSDHARVIVPYIVNANTNSSTLMPGDCSDCDVVILPGKTLTVNADKEVHNLTVYDGATLDITNGATLTVNSLILNSEGDQSAPNVTITDGSINLNHDELYHDRRIDDQRYYWLTLPFDAQTQEISYSNIAANDKSPVYRTDFWLKYYDGARRADDANGGYQANTYWTHVAAANSDYTMKAGQGYIIGIKDQANVTQADGRKHTKRVLRFTMRPGNAWLQQESMSAKVANVTPSTCSNPKNNQHAGWNLIGNPYMHTYTTGAVTGTSGLRNGAWIKEEDEDGVWTGFYILDDTDTENRPTNVPYLTYYDAATDTYSQELASGRTLRPFEPVFVQINEGSIINFTSNMNVNSMPAYMRLAEEEAPIYTGIVIEGNEASDRTGVVLSDDFTSDYEIGADLQKMINNKRLNLYTLNDDNQRLAFIGLSEQDAIEPIPMGVTFPKAGEYTIKFDAQQYSSNALDTLMLMDYVTGETIDLLWRAYTFNVESAGNVDSRFALLVRVAKTPQITTDVENMNIDTTKPRKVIRNNHLYILREEEIYNATGAKIK